MKTNTTTRSTNRYRCTYCNWHGTYEQIQVRVYNAGCDWEDSQSYCPTCGQPNESGLIVEVK
jgi:DNA-directed RNA polymerase subunit RPC12/RpoP